MNDFKMIHDRMGETLQAFSPYYREAMIKHLQQSEAPANWFPLNFVRASEPEPFHLSTAESLTPYIALSRQRERYDALADAGCLEPLGGDIYRLTDKGRQVVEGFFAIAHEELTGVDVLPADELDRLADYLGRIVTSTVECPEPAEKPSLLASRWTDPGPKAAAPVRIDQYVTDLLRYRDDAHIGAWRPTGVDGKTWETLTLLWQGEASSVAEVGDRLSGRGYGREEYAQALEVLAGKRWIAADDAESEGYRITQQGKQVRQKAEEETDRLYYLGWAALSQEEMEALDDLLARLNEALRVDTLHQCWSQTRELGRAITPVTREAVNDIFHSYFDSPRAFFPTLMAFGAQPQPLSAADYRRRYPYTKPERAQELLGEAAASGCLARQGDEFMLTDKGKEAIVQVNDVFYKALAEIDPLPEEESAELAGQLYELVEATLEADKPKEKWSLKNIHNCHPKIEYGPLARIDQAIDDLNGFRDDVHMASWAHRDVTARDWDALTLVWRGVATNAKAIAEDLQFKGYSAGEYAESLDRLVELGWLGKVNGAYQVTEQGRQVRQEAEQVTDRYFFGPWQELEGGRLLRLHTLLTQMKLGLQALAEEPADTG